MDNWKETYQILKDNKKNIYTYPELCKIFGETTCEGNKKKQQLNNWNRYISYEKKNKYFKIEDVYEIPLPEEYKYPANAIYSDCIEKILLSYLSKQEDNVAYLSTQYLYYTLGMVTYEYISMQFKNNKNILIDILKQEFPEDEKIIKYYINNFYDRCRDKFTSIINSALKSLSNRKLIDYDIVYKVIEEIVSESGQIIETNEWYATSDNDKEKILAAERECLLELGYEFEYELWYKNQYPEFFELVNKRLYEKYGWKKILRYYQIRYHAEHIQIALENSDILLKKKELNEKVISFINTQAKKNYLEAVGAEITDEIKEMLQLMTGSTNLPPGVMVQKKPLKVDKKTGETVDYTELYVAIQEFLADKLLKIC